MQIDNASYNLMIGRAIVSKDLDKYYEIIRKYQPKDSLSINEKRQAERNKLIIQQLEQEKREEAEKEYMLQRNEQKEKFIEDFKRDIDEILKKGDIFSGE